MTDLDLRPPVIRPPVPESPTRPTTRRSGRWHPSSSPLSVLLCGTFMIVLDFFIVNVALPSMKGGLRTSNGAIEWVVAGYGLTFAVLLVTAGRLGDRFGRRRVFSVGLATFVAASAACGLAPSAEVLVAGRLVQGIGAALISPNVLSIIGVAYQGRARVRAITVYGVVMGLAAACGQLIGGVLIQSDVAGLGWRAIFLINLPVGAAGLALAPFFVPESRAPRAASVDLGGIGLVTVVLVAVTLPLVEGRELDWPVWTWISLGLTPALAGVFVAHQRWLAGRGPAPLLDLDLLRSRALRAGLLTQLAFWCGQASLFLVLALYLQNGRGLDPLDAGLVTTIMAGAYLGTSLVAPSLTVRLGGRIVVAGALTLAAGEGVLLGGVLLMGNRGSVGLLVPGLVLVGAGMGWCLTPLTTTILVHASPERAGSVSGVLATMQQVGNSLGVAVIGVIFFGLVPHGYSRAFEVSLGVLASLLLGVAVLARALLRGPDPAGSPGAEQKAGETAVSAAR